MATTTTTGTRTTGATHQPRLAAARPRRRRGVIAGGLMVTALAGALVAWLVGAAGGRTDVLVVARDVPYGQTLVAGDLTLTAVAVDTLVETVPADQLDAMLGLVAATDLPAGALLSPAQVTADAPPGDGEVLVPLPVNSERLPAGGVQAGDRLLVVDAPTAGADPLPTAPRTFEVTVIRLGEPDMNGLSVLDVAADENDGAGLAARAASGRFALVLLDAGDRP
ncbi:SAF domain-containing protein [Actinotalea subterranea]|uniref:SAF domain-containing protein n=1 Tax=Actinotalea subterranea TaxID=2607497 RepID=UPI0011ED0700|nr:SAF domain-containing protein [Actinotalea subterranea]